MILSFVLFVLAIVYLIDVLINDQRRHKLCKAFDGPWRMWLIGNLYLYINMRPEEALVFTRNLIRKYGSTMRIWVGPKLAFMTADPRYFEVILSSQKLLMKSNMYDFLSVWLGNGLLLSSGQKWRNRRKAITPAFHFNILEQFIDVFHRQSEILVEKLKKKANGKPFDVYPDVMLMTLDVLTETAMGTQVNAQLNAESEYANAVNEISYIISMKLTKFWHRIDFLFQFTSAKKRLDELLRISHKFTIDIIVKRRDALLESRRVRFFDGEYFNFGSRKKMALLDVLLMSTIDGKPLTNEDIQEEVQTFSFEGHESTSSAISFTLYLLAKHPKVQKKVYQEIMAVTGGQLCHLTYSVLQELKYMEWVIKETLRLYPAVPIFSRRTEEDLEIDGRTIPANSNINLLPYVLNMDPKYFPDPEKFYPERFGEVKNEVENFYMFVPFSAGPRNCIGQKFAMLEIKSAISHLITNFELVPSDIEPRLSFQLTLKSLNGIHVGFRKRPNPKK